MALGASATGKWLILSGQAARTGYQRVYVDLYSKTVKDNGQDSALVPITGDASHVSRVSARDLTGTGASVYADDAWNTIDGSAQSDYIYSSGGNDSLRGLSGEDILVAGTGDDVLSGGRGIDRLSGDEGDDTISGGAGSDTINGGADTDTVVLTGARSDYTLMASEGQWLVTDKRARSPDGTDAISNVEFLQFSDQTVKLDATLTDLVATASGKWLTLSGQAAESGDDWIFVGLHSNTIIDNNKGSVIVNISGDISHVSSFSARDLIGAGVYLTAEYVDGAWDTIIGSRQADYVYASEGNDRLRGLSGDDFLATLGGNDVLMGDRGDDSLNGGDGNDKISGGSGSDRIGGGAGTDTVVLTGARSDYTLVALERQWRVTDNRARSPDGTDTIGDVEFLQFSDQTVGLPILSPAAGDFSI